MPLSDDPETQAGLATRRKVLGDAYVDAALTKVTPFTEPLQELVTKHAWGNTWQRPGLDLEPHPAHPDDEYQPASRERRLARGPDRRYA